MVAVAVTITKAKRRICKREKWMRHGLLLFGGLIDERLLLGR